MPSLKAQRSPLASAAHQLAQLGQLTPPEIPPFAEKLRESGLQPLTPTGVETLQINLGKMCNQTCSHCHVDAGPDRREIMTKETMEQCLEAIERAEIKNVDLTGGAPEMNPHFRWFVQEIRARGAHVMDRCNLTILLAHEKYKDLPEFFKEHQVEVISSLPHYTSLRTNRQRGQGVFERSIEALQRLNQVGYGQANSGLKLNLVYNPAGAYLAGDQCALERDFKNRLQRDFGIEFNSLFCITNMPISRFLEYLIQSENFAAYMQTLLKAYNPTAAQGVMCRSLISVGWDGSLYDCDFNQMLEMGLEAESPQHISEFNRAALMRRHIRTHQHCYGCTAGSGSSCGGATA